MGLLVSTVNLTVLGLDRLPRTRLVAVRVLLTRRVVSDDDTLDVHGEWSLGVVGQTTSPLNGTRLVVRVTTGPASHYQVHWGLWVATAGVASQTSNQSTVQQEISLFLCPVDGVSVELLLWRVDTVEGTTVPGGCVTLGEVVGLELSGVTTGPFQVDLVKVVTLQVE